MTARTFSMEEMVRNEWVDYNGHMNDAAYAQVFSLAVDAFMDWIGLDAEARSQYRYTIFTLETHICYLKEAHEQEALQLNVQLLDMDAKRLHVFYEMRNAKEELLATSEQMLMGMDTDQGRPAPFPATVQGVLNALWELHKDLEKPKQAGRQIGIKK
ncbi:MAG TPA: thioesterase family protein [Planococcus sp. (in: firmicutes)]|nr:thioesterase family protein [Planococcus sp. (in: firmicutes)]